MIDQGNLVKKWQILKTSSWERDTTESELSVELRSFVNQVNDQVRKRQKNFQTLQKKEKNILLDGECLWL